MSVFITYFLGCIWYIISNRLNPDSTERTFITEFELGDETDPRKLLLSSYFCLTTLSTVGYGDFYPISNIERLYTIIL